MGDDASDRQYRSILSFNTSALPNTAVITGVTLQIKLAGSAGTNPYSTHGSLLVDVRTGSFSSNSALQLGDFQASAGLGAVGSIPNAPSGGWYTKTWTSGILSYINKSGLTQLRLRFGTGDNDDLGADYLKFYSGDTATSTDRPLLVITYYVP